MDKKQQYVLGGLLFVFAFSFGLNEFIHTAHKEQASTEIRGIASLGDNTASKEEIKWEQNLARTLSESKSIAGTKIADKPTDLDQLIFGSLQGKYEVDVQNGMVKGIVLKRTEAVGIEMEVEDLLKQHAAVFSRMDSLKKGETQKNGHEVTETYTWKDSSGTQHSIKVGYQAGESSDDKVAKYIKTLVFQ